jgi:hypothetical protein
VETGLFACMSKLWIQDERICSNVIRVAYAYIPDFVFAKTETKLHGLKSASELYRPSDRRLSAK